MNTSLLMMKELETERRQQEQALALLNLADAAATLLESINLMRLQIQILKESIRSDLYKK